MVSKHPERRDRRKKDRQKERGKERTRQERGSFPLLSSHMCKAASFSNPWVTAEHAHVHRIGTEDALS